MIAFYFNYRAYRCWKRLGGDTAYTPPTARFRYRDLPKAADTGVVWGLVAPVALAFVGSLAINFYYVYYFHVHAGEGHARNTLVFAVYGAIMVVLFAAYLRFVRFVERP